MEDSLHYRFHIRLSNDGTAQPQEVHCTPERIKEIERCSILLRQRIKDAGNCGVILLETDDEANINLDVFRYLIRDLPLEPGADPGLVKLDVLSTCDKPGAMLAAANVSRIAEKFTIFNQHCHCIWSVRESS